MQTIKQNIKIDPKNEWLTPINLIESLGSFDLDPCSPIDRPWNTALNHFTQIDNGLKQNWLGRVWCNPPYGKESQKWIERCIEHKNCMALTFVRSDTRLFHDIVFPNATALLFLQGRIKFYTKNGERADSSVSPSVLISFDDYNAEVLKECQLKGFYIDLRN